MIQPPPEVERRVEAQERRVDSQEKELDTARIRLMEIQRELARRPRPQT